MQKMAFHAFTILVDAFNEIRTGYIYTFYRTTILLCKIAFSLPSHMTAKQKRDSLRSSIAIDKGDRIRSEGDTLYIISFD